MSFKSYRRKNVLKKSSCLIVLLSLTIIFFSPLHGLSVDLGINPATISHTPHEPISITSDEDFIIYGFTGNGTIDKPYIIKGLIISTTSDIGIHIEHTTKFFIISNCFVRAKLIGINIRSIAPGTAIIENNVCQNCINGIGVSYSESLSVINNSCSFNSIGIEMYSSPYSSVTNNTCSYNEFGIELLVSVDLVAVDNDCKYNSYGIRVIFYFHSYVYNNTIINNICSNNMFGITSIGAEMTTIDSNICDNNSKKGIYVYASGFSTVANNTCRYNKEEGISLYLSRSSYVVNNTCYDNNGGVYLYDSESSIVANNFCSYNIEDGINVERSESSTLCNNTCMCNNGDGIDLIWSDSAKITNNTFVQNGLNIRSIDLTGYRSYTVSNNIVNGKPLGFFANLNEPILNEPIYGQLFLINCKKAQVNNQVFTNTSIGLFLAYCFGSTVTNNIYENNLGGIFIEGSDYSVLSNNTCNNNEKSIIVESSDNVKIMNNTFTNSDYGIFLYHSLSVEVLDNTCYSNAAGIYLKFSDYSVLSNNTCSYNGEGIFIYRSDNVIISNNSCNYNDNGIFLHYSLLVIVYNNTCSSNINGISLYFSDSCVLSYNILHDNSLYGVYLSSSSDNLIHHNAFINNNPEGTSQAYDAGVDNSWYLKHKGNYWSDWLEGDYLIDGIANSTDCHPLTDIPTTISTDSTTDTSSGFIIQLFTMIILIVITLKKRFAKQNAT